MYSLVDDSGGRFTIETNTGVIQVSDGSLIDHESMTSHDVTVRVADSQGNAHDETFRIEVQDNNEAPVTDVESYSVLAGNGLSVGGSGVLNGDYDPDGNTLSAVLLSGPNHGVLTLNGDGSFTYTPDDGFSGTDTFSYEAWDGSLSSASTLVTIDVQPVGAPPPPPPPPPAPDAEPEAESDPDAEPDPEPEDPIDDADEEENETTITSNTGGQRNAPPLAETPGPSGDAAVIAEAAQGDDAESMASLLESSVQGSGQVEKTDGARRSLAEFDDTKAESRSFAQSMEFAAASDHVLMASPGLMWNELDQQMNHVESQIQGDLIVVGAAGAAASSFTIGVVAWALRTGFLASGLLAQLPAWSAIDPLTVMQGLGESDNNETLEEMMKRQSEELDD